MTRSTKQNLEKCKASIRAHVARGGTRHSIRGQALECRYDGLRLAAIEAQEWLGFCATHDLMPSHRGFDLFA